MASTTRRVFGLGPGLPAAAGTTTVLGTRVAAFPTVVAIINRVASLFIVDDKSDEHVAAVLIELILQGVEPAAHEHECRTQHTDEGE